MKYKTKEVNQFQGIAEVALLLYFFWWAYFVYFLYLKDYDDNYAAATASTGLLPITIALMGLYEIGFITAAIRTKARRFFHLATVVTLPLPLICVWLFETFNQH